MDTVKRNPHIDFVKGISILVIMLCHTMQVNTDLNVYLRTIFSIGRLGCQFFFFYTGYLLMKRELTHNKAYSVKEWFSFMKKRICSVVVPWYLAIIIYYFIINIGKMDASFPYSTNRNPLSIFLNVLLIQGIDPNSFNTVVPGGWYIGTLFFLWVIFPIAFNLKLKYGNKILVIIVLFCFASMFSFGMLKGVQYVSKSSFLYYSFINQLPCMIIGMLSADSSSFLNKIKPNIIINALCGSMIVCLFYTDLPFSSCIIPLLVSFFAHSISNLPNNMKYNSIISKALISLGKNSIYYYLTHIIVVWYIQWYFWRYVNKFDAISDNSTAYLILFILTAVVEVFLIQLLFKFVCNKIDSLLHYKKRKGVI